jgi:hypothetical protein
VIAEVSADGERKRPDELMSHNIYEAYDDDGRLKKDHPPMEQVEEGSEKPVYHEMETPVQAQEMETGMEVGRETQGPVRRFEMEG